MNSVRRPKSLREVGIETHNYRDFGANLKDFLHEFEFARKKGLPLQPLLAEAPPCLAARFPQGNVCDAFLAATADHLSRVNAIRTPSWALEDNLILEQPWFSEQFRSVRMRLLRDTPSAFKDKNLFVFESALQVV